MEEIKNKLINFIEKISFYVGYFDLYKNTSALLFMKYVVTYLDKLNIKSLDSYKELLTFSRKYNEVKLGNGVFAPYDFNLFLSLLDKELNDGKTDFVNLVSIYTRIFNDENKQRDILKTLDEFTYFDNKDLLFSFYELLLDYTKNDVRRSAEFSSSKSIRNIAARILKVTKEDKLLDSFCGVSSFLFNVKEYKQYCGCEINQFVSIISKINAIVLGLNDFSIINDDFKAAKFDTKFDKIFADGPIAQLMLSENIPGTDLKTTDSTLISLYKIYDLLEDDGTAVITLPAKMLFSTIKSYTYTRKFLIEHGLKAVISLPPLWKNTGINTNIIIIRKNYKGKITFINAISDDSKTRTFGDEEVASLLKTLLLRTDINGYSKTLTKESLSEENGYSLMPNRYIEVVREESYDLSIDEINSKLEELYDLFKKTI